MIELPESPDAPVLLHGDCLDLLALLPTASVHVVVTDPPAGIGFMGKPWDSFAGYQPRTARGRDVVDRLLGLLPTWAVGFVGFLTDVWSEVDRVLKPGGWICAWALPKTADLAGLAGRAVGWEAHDSLLHLFGGGMPKGDNIGKRLDKMAGAEREVVGVNPSSRPNSKVKGARCFDGIREHTESAGVQTITAPATEAARRWDGWNTQLAPGYEQWLLFRKPTRLTFAANALAHCTGVLNVDACRIPRGEAEQAAKEEWFSRYGGRDYASGVTLGFNDGDAHRQISAPNPGGSWPRNVVITCGGEECPAEALDRQSGQQKSARATKRADATAFSSGTISDENPTRYSPSYEGEVGGASRFFTRFDDPRPFDDRVRYQAKASDRGAGLRTDIVNAHPTHKHVDLMRWLVRLLAATAETTGDEAAIVLDCFAGSFTTGVACVAERVRFVGIERDAASFEVGRARVLAAIGSPEAAAEANAVAPDGSQLALL